MFVSRCSLVFLNYGKGSFFHRWHFEYVGLNSQLFLQLPSGKTISFQVEVVVQSALSPMKKDLRKNDIFFDFKKKISFAIAVLSIAYIVMLLEVFLSYIFSFC
ncbi:MAG: hypothetical protein A2007_05795 [Verrucomicrobia bacterium GWC2_42_7]|nr:MAG: hypothetical protein A2007_05795 [Verrucomicrobia bacterium GWC2_42_7]